VTNRIPADAFEAYVAMGEGRSYRALARRLGVSKRAITKHAHRERWSERLGAIEAEARERSDRKLVESLEEMRERHRKTLRAMHARALTALKEYPLTSAMEAIRAAELVIKLERLVAGEPSERSELAVQQTTRTEIERLLTQGPEEDEERDWRETEVPAEPEGAKGPDDPEDFCDEQPPPDEDE